MIYSIQSLGNYLSCKLIDCGSGKLMYIDASVNPWIIYRMEVNLLLLASMQQNMCLETRAVLRLVWPVDGIIQRPFVVQN